MKRMMMTLFFMTALLCSVINGASSNLNLSQKANAQLSLFQKSTQFSAPPGSACKKLPIVGIVASGNDGHVPTNVLDNNLNTRWSSLGIGSWIQADLGDQKIVCSIDIAWYRGNLRHDNFAISISTDGTSFTTVFRGKSSGTTLFVEKYNLPSGVTARYVRVTVNGNTENNWASITELSVDGITTVPKNNQPTADSLKVQITSNTNKTITLTGTDLIPNDILKFSVVNLPFNGNLSDGKSFNTIVYTPNQGFVGHDRFTYRATDGRGEVSNSATVFITVSAPPPPPPTANNLKVQTTSNTNVTIKLNGTDPIKGDRLRFSVIEAPINGVLFKGKTTDTITYKSNADFVGDDAFTYRSTDGLGVNSTVATVHITVKAAPPTAPPPLPPQKPSADNLTISTNANTPVHITLTGTSPIPNDVLKFSVVTMPKFGRLDNPSSNTVTYTPNTGFSGHDSFIYKSTDSQKVSSNNATVSITVNPVQPPPPQKPTANNLTISTNANTPVHITLTGTPAAPGDTPTFAVVAMPQHGAVAKILGSPSDVTYTPAAGYSGPDSFTYRVTDSHGVNSNIATVSITVNPIQQPPPPPPPAQQPTANNISTSTNTSTPVRITLTGTDPIPGDMLKFSVVTLPQHGIVSPIPGANSNSVTYTPNTGFSGQDSFTYLATNGRGANSTIAKVSISVNGPEAIPPSPSPSPPPPPLPAPTVNNINIQTNKGAPVQITLSGTDPIPGDMLKFSLVALPKNGVVTNSTVSSTKFYTPNPGFIGADSFTYKATDGQGVASSNIATVNILVSNSTSGNLDPFGIKEIYPTKTGGGEQWFMNMADPNHDTRTEPQTTLTKNSDGSWKITSSAVRFNVFTSSGYHHELITTLNQAQLAAKGYMQSPNDWKNIEMTGYVKFNKGDASDGFTWYARGGHHTSSIPCEGTSIKEELDFAGTTRFEKEQWHVHYVFTPHKPATGPIQGKWVGYKAIMYNVIQNGMTALKEEIWLDPNDNGNWVKVNEFIDAGGFGDQGQVCGGKPDQIITWGGPIATFRWDKTTDVDIKDFSVREIQPPQ